MPGKTQPRKHKSGFMVYDSGPKQGHVSAHRAVAVNPGMAEPDIDPSEFIVPAADQKGHSEKLTIRLPPIMKGQINTLIQRFRGRIPWETDADYARWCIFLGNNIMSRRLDDDAFTNVNTVMASWIEVARIERSNIEFIEGLTYVTEAVQGLLRHGMQGKAKKMVEAMAERITDHEDPGWRRKIGAEMVDRFGYLMGEKHAKSLMRELGNLKRKLKPKPKAKPKGQPKPKHRPRR